MGGDDTHCGRAIFEGKMNRIRKWSLRTIAIVLSFFFSHDTNISWRYAGSMSDIEDIEVEFSEDVMRHMENSGCGKGRNRRYGTQLWRIGLSAMNFNRKIFWR